MTVSGPGDRVRDTQALERRLVEAFVVVVLPLHMLLPTVAGWLMVLAALRGLVVVARRPAFEPLDRLYLVACAVIPAAYVLNMALAGWAPSWLHRPAHLLLTGGLVFLWIGRIGMSERALFRAVVLASFTALGIALFDVLVHGSARVFGWRHQWNAVPFGNFSLLLGFIAFAGSIGPMLAGTQQRMRVGLGLAATAAGILASILAGTRGGWLAIPVLLALSFWSAWRAYRGRVLSSWHFIPALGAMLVFMGLLTNFVSNNAAAAIGTPIAIEVARSLGAPAEPFVLAILFGCNLSYATPIAYQTNLLVMSAARYRFVDFVRVGGPLLVLMAAALTAMIGWRYSLWR